MVTAEQRSCGVGRRGQYWRRPFGHVHGVVRLLMGGHFRSGSRRRRRPAGAASALLGIAVAWGLASLDAATAAHVEDFTVDAFCITSGFDLFDVWEMASPSDSFASAGYGQVWQDSDARWSSDAGDCWFSGVEGATGRGHSGQLVDAAVNLWDTTGSSGGGGSASMPAFAGCTGGDGADGICLCA